MVFRFFRLLPIFALLLLALCIYPAQLKLPLFAVQSSRAAVCPPEGCKTFLPAILRYIDQVSNGDFESGPVSWREYSALGYFIILRNPGELQISPHSGSWAAWLGGADGETASIEQSIFVSAVRPYLRYWEWIVSDEPNCSKDKAQISIDMVILVQMNLCQATSTLDWQVRLLDLRAYAGQVVNLRFLVTTDTALDTQSSLYLDDISLQVAP